MLIKMLKGFAMLWFVLAAIFIGGSLILIWYSEGFGKVQEIMNPFNLFNVIAVMITLAPGIGAYMLADHLETKKK